MDKLNKYALHFIKLELIKHRLEVFQNESGSRGVDLIVKTRVGKYHELLLQVLNLESNERSVKVLKSEWDYQLTNNRWIALALFMKEMEPKAYLIPSNVFHGPDEYSFFDNDQGERMKHFSNWEIKIFAKGIEELSQFALANSVKKLV